MSISRRHLFRSAIGLSTAVAAAPILPPIRRVERPVPVRETIPVLPGEYRLVIKFDNAPDIIVPDPFKTVRRRVDPVNDCVHITIDPIVVDCTTLPMTEHHYTNGAIAVRVEASWLGPDTWLKVIEWKGWPFRVDPYGSLTLKTDGDITIA